MRNLLIWLGAAAIVIGAVLIAVARHHETSLVAARSVSAPAVVAPVPPASVTLPLTGPGGFAPLDSQAVKNAIHRALVTGTTQRWQDGALSGYAVPSTTAGANGCRAVRYTIDQQPDTPYGSITACDASGH